MIARPHALGLMLAVFAAAWPAVSAESRNTIPAAPPPAEKKSSAVPPPSIPAATPAPAPVTSSPALIEAPAVVKATEATAKPAAVPASGNATTTPAAPAATPEPHRSGVFSAVKAKGPPPAGKAPVAPTTLPPRFQQIRTRIGALFDNRSTPPAPIDPMANPFRPAGAMPIAPLPAVEGAAPATVVANSDLVSLQQAVATLRVKGTFRRGKILQLVITSAPGKEGTYKEGDIINVLLPPGDPIHVRVRQISANSVTLSLNAAEMVLKF
jgi:hypothetical protein